MTEMALLDAAPRPPGLRSRFVEGIGGLGLHVLEAGSSQTWAPGSPSPDPKWRLVTEVLGWGRFLTPCIPKFPSKTRRTAASPAARSATSGV